MAHPVSPAPTFPPTDPSPFHSKSSCISRNCAGGDQEPLVEAPSFLGPRSLLGDFSLFGGSEAGAFPCRAFGLEMMGRAWAPGQGKGASQLPAHAAPCLQPSTCSEDWLQDMERLSEDLLRPLLCQPWLARLCQDLRYIQMLFSIMGGWFPSSGWNLHSEGGRIPGRQWWCL